MVPRTAFPAFCCREWSTHSQAQSKGHFSWGLPVPSQQAWLGMLRSAPGTYPGDGVYRADFTAPLGVWAGVGTGAVTGPGQETRPVPNMPLTGYTGVAQSLRMSYTREVCIHRVPICQEGGALASDGLDLGPLCARPPSDPAPRHELHRKHGTLAGDHSSSPGLHLQWHHGQSSRDSP